MRTTVALAFIGFSTLSASAADNAPQKIDEVFAPYNNPHSPGCSVGVIRDGGFIFRKAYGEGSLELGSPLSSDSVFYMASVSKQFTAASIVLAAEQGLLSLDDDVRKYISELPSYGHTISLRQMLHQTSGFRDFLALTYLAGRDISALSSSNDVLKLIVRQKGLNNLPGEEFVYSNTNYFLLGMVVKRASGKPLAEFAAANIFRPLGMTKTLFYDDNSVVVPNRVAGYAPGKAGGFQVDWSTIFDIVGSGGLMSTVNDLLLWDRNFYSGKVGKGSLEKELEAHGFLNNGHPINYGLGLWLGEYHGLKTVEHSGGTFGYRTELLRFPERRFSVVVLCNIANADVEGFARKISDLYLEKELRSEANIPARSSVFPDPTPFAGTYLDPRKHIIYTFTAASGNLMGWGSKLERLGANEFSDLVGNPIVFKSAQGTMTATLTLQGDPYFSGHMIPKIQLSESALSRFTGKYHSDELAATYELSLVKGVLTLKNGNQTPANLLPVGANEFQAGDLGTIVFSVTTSHHVTGLTLFSQPARGITFAKGS
ncbi:MAG TPA: serine hydrolase domain-containing protein [Bryobacteraceae bacterium]|nr:serine hydrolase domain-containing protein [Bryobacteraceae bacterium]